MGKEDHFTYARSGVDRQTHGTITTQLKSQLKMKDARILNGVGAFASLFEAKFPGIEDPVLVLKAEEPGSKQYLARQFGKIDNIGFDMVNHLMNDILVMGAKPLAVLDVIVCGKINKDDILKIVATIAQACENHDCSLVGGETSEQPGVVPDDVFVLSSSVVGVVGKSKIIDGSRIEAGDKVLALSSNGLFTNGYALVRKLIAAKPGIANREIDGASFLDAVLTPHLAYYPYLKDILGSAAIHGLAHITGDGISGNLERILPEGLSASVDLNKIKVLPIFNVIRQEGEVPEEDMLANSNLGVGMTVVSNADESASLIAYLGDKGLLAYEIGQIIKEPSNSVLFRGYIDWTRA